MAERHVQQEMYAAWQRQEERREAQQLQRIEEVRPVALITNESCAFKMMAGIDMVHVPYRGNGPAITDLLGGQVQVLFAGAPESIEHIRAGRLRPLAVTDTTRLEALPDIPTVGEFVAGYEASAWQGLGAPKNTPADIVDKLNKEINAGLADPKIKARLTETLGGTVLAGSPRDFGQFIVDETEKWGKVIRALNIKAE